MNNQIKNIKKQILSKFNKGQNIVLSTSANDIVTSRAISTISFEDALYFTSIERPGATKNEQMKANSNVALCMNTIQITGVATLLGSALDEKNSDVMNRYKEILPQSYDMFVTSDSCKLFKVQISTFKDWKMVDGERKMTIVDFENKMIIKNELY